MNAIGWGVFFSMLLWPYAALANAGVPMVAINAPLLLLALLPVIGIERWLLARGLARPPREVGTPVALANLASTLVGYPLSWLLLLALEWVVPATPALSLSVWFLPGKELSHTTAGHIATLIGMLAAYGVSCPMEYLILRWRLPEVAPDNLRPLVWRMNAVSYGVLAAIYALVQIIG